jgi:ribosomal protein L5
MMRQRSRALMRAWYVQCLVGSKLLAGDAMENNLRKLREAAGMSPVELAAQVGVSPLDIRKRYPSTV